MFETRELLQETRSWPDKKIAVSNKLFAKNNFLYLENNFELHAKRKHVYTYFYSL